MTGIGRLQRLAATSDAPKLLPAIENFVCAPTILKIEEDLCARRGSGIHLNSAQTTLLFKFFAT
jgi:hypothetical protein